VWEGWVAWKVKIHDSSLVGRSPFSILYKSISSTVATKSSLSTPHRRSQRTQNAYVSSNPGKTPRRSIHLYSTL